ncbi:MAG TPA: TolC family protein [Bryobacteraceae bacterium]|nr:TolC family protein [Bryobacteraceae bacterium]
MGRRTRYLVLCIASALAAIPLSAQQPQTYSWQQLRDKFEAGNSTLRAGQLNIEESKAQETTAYLRPNPDFALSTDGTQLTPYQGVYRPFAGTQFSPSVSYLHERNHQRELRLESAQKGTSVAQSQQQDLERNLLFNLRNAFVQALQAKAILAVAKENLDYYDRVLAISRTQLSAGNISQVDLDRLELQRVQYEAELQTADTSVRTARIQLLMLMNDRTPVDQFDVSGTFDFAGPLDALDSFHRIALDTRPDLRAAMQTVNKAKTDHQLAIANGSADPTFSAWWTHNPSFNNIYDYNTIGASISIPLRIFDRNQGEKERTDIEIRRTERLQEAATAQIFNDVDSAWTTVNSSLTLLRPYKDKYLAQALRVRDTMTFAYQRGGASLLDFLSAQNDYRSTQLNYLNLVGSYLTAANQLNLAVGREVIQ